MDWKLNGCFKKKLYKNENLDVLEFNIIKFNKKIDSDDNTTIEETENIIIDVFIKKNKYNEFCLFTNNSLIEHINKIIEKINPLFVLTFQILIPLIKPAQCKIDVDSLKIIEIFMNKQLINFNQNFNLNLFKNNCSINNENINSNPNENNNFDETKSESDESDSDETDTSNSSDSENSSNVNSPVSSEIESNSDDETILDKLKLLKSPMSELKNNQHQDINNGELNKIFNLLGGNNNFLPEKLNDFNELGELNELSELKELGELKELNELNKFDKITDIFNIVKGMKFEDNQNQNKSTLNNNLIDGLKNIWTSDYNDDSSLDDFLINDTEENPEENPEENLEENLEENPKDIINENLTKYLELESSDISLEICLSNFNDFISHRNLINTLFTEESFNETINSFELNNEIPFIPNIPGISKWISTDSNNNKYFSYKIGQCNNIREYKLEHYMQFKQILLLFLDYVENNNNL